MLSNRAYKRKVQEGRLLLAQNLKVIEDMDIDA